MIPATSTPGPVSSGPLLDRFGRSKHKLRISLTDRCNFRCTYCMPEDPEWLPRSEILSFEELQRVVGLCVSELGITHLRLTGGEPLLRKGVAEFVRGLDALRAGGLRRISMTSNGALLARHARSLRSAGLDDINISIDALDPERFRALTRAAIEPVLEGIRAARDAGLPVKLNAVIVRGQNEQEVLPLARWACAEGVDLRYIEFMPLDGMGSWSPERVVPEADIIAALSTHFEIERLPRSREPATYYRLDGKHRIGVISTVSNPFCGSCDRLRLTATGEIFPCLFSPAGYGLKDALRGGADDAALLALIRGAVWRKGQGFIASAGYVQRQAGMHTLGG